MTKVKLAHPGLIYMLHVNPARYTEAFGGLSWSNKMRQAVACHIRLKSNACYIDELALELQSASQNGRSGVIIPPFILFHMLEFLCCRHVNTMRAQAALDDLQALVHREQEMLVHVLLRDISWQILGICQQIGGNHQAALFCYRMSLTQIPFNNIHTATRLRINDLLLLTH